MPQITEPTAYRGIASSGIESNQELLFQIPLVRIFIALETRTQNVMLCKIIF